MNTNEKAGVVSTGPERLHQGHGKPSATPRKWQRVLSALAQGTTLNRFEAAGQLRDWCLNTTIDQLQKRGVKILRTEETVPGAYGPVHCLRYSLAPESAEHARTLLGKKEACASTS